MPPGKKWQVLIFPMNFVANWYSSLNRTFDLADFVVVEENPLENLKVLYGTGAIKLSDETGLPERVGGIKYTIKDGIIYDAKQLLEDVREMVREAKQEAGLPNAPLMDPSEMTAPEVESDDGASDEGN